MNVFVLTCDKYAPIVAAMGHLFNRAWSPKCPVTVVHYGTKPMNVPRNFTLFDNGSDPGFASGLIRFLERLNDEHMILLLDDYFLIGADTGKLERLQKLAERHPEIAKIDLTDDRMKVQHSDLDMDGLKLVKSYKNAPFLFSLQAAIWRRDFLLRFLQAGDNPWETEKRGTGRVQAAYKDGTFDGLILGCPIPPLTYVNAVGGQGEKPGEYDWKKFPDWMKVELKSKGLI